MKKTDIVYENEEILVINKESGVAVQGGPGISHPLDKELPLIVGYPVYLVHRLDRDTSGLMIVAKDPVSANKWTKMIGGKLIQKEYTALCVGKMKNRKGTLRTSVLQHGDEKSAVTHYEVISEKILKIEDKDYTFSLLKLVLETGRMHQIRIHLAKEGCPIVQDDKHGDFKLNKLIKKALKIKTLCLQATRLTIPIKGKAFVIEVPVPEYMQNI